MYIKTSELDGAALDWAVAQRECQDNEEMIISISPGGRINVIIEPESCYHYRPSTDWSQGGRLVEKHVFRMEQVGTHTWLACMYHSVDGQWLALTGPTLLIAAMRAIVASEVGDEVDVPEELL